jgi:glycosyltransferase involved in cell wall biosynthesis
VTSTLHVISGLFHGGGQRVVEDLLAVQQCGGDVEPRLCVLGTGGRIANQAHHTVPYNGKYNNPLVLNAAARNLRSVIRDGSFDVVHSHGLDADLITGLAVRSRDIVHVCHLHITPSADRAESWKAAIRRRLFTHLAKQNRTWFIAVSEAVRLQMASYYRLPLERIITVRNGIDLSAFPEPECRNSSDAGKLVIGTAARLAPMKGLEHLIDAAARLKQLGVSHELRIAGSGSLLDTLRQQAARLSLGDEVRFLGQVDDMPAFYRQLDVFVLPSVSTEGLPLTVLESMASGVPVVATDVGGTAEALRGGVDGFVVPPGDVSALVAAIERLARSPELGQQMGASGRARVVSDFSRERVAREVADVYRRVLAERTADGARR